MATERCPLCGTRKARRACPALGRDICAVCCGTKRLVEIACPPDCGWLRASAQHPPAVAQRRQERDLAFIYGALGDLSERQARVLLYLQALVKQCATAASAAVTGLAPFVDRDVADAAGSLASAFETSAKGILYEHQAASIPAQRLAADLKRGLEELARAERSVPDLDLAAALRMLETLARGAGSTLGDGARTYLDLVDRVMKPAAADARAESQKRVIVP
ncbi:MAG: hypothetical protein ACRD1S_00465 [Vicinamibacterales bacterium]